MNHRALLHSFGPCQDAADWYNDQDSQEAWGKCACGDWLLWVAAELEIDRQTVVLAACDCAELALLFVPSGEGRPRRAINLARQWASGEATIEDVRQAADAAAHAAHAAASCSASASASARKDTLEKCATIVRQRIPWDAIQERINVAEAMTKGTSNDRPAGS